jgi:hypothetical protein
MVVVHAIRAWENLEALLMVWVPDVNDRRRCERCGSVEWYS